MLDPSDPDHQGAEWIQTLERYFRVTDDDDAGGADLGGFTGFKLALKRRSPSSPGLGWVGVARSLLQWHVKNRLAKIFSEESGQVYRAVEALEMEELKTVCTTLGTDIDDPEWHDNRRGLYDHLVLEQKKEIDAELSTMPALPDPAPPAPFIEVNASHPLGMGPLAPRIGRYRTHFPLMARLALGPTELPEATMSVIGTPILRCCKVSRATPHLEGWLGLTGEEQEVMISGLIGGVLPGLKPMGAITLEGVETVQPHRHLIFAPDEWDSLIPVASPAEAWAAYDADNGLQWFSLVPTPSTVLDDASTWAGFAVSRDGRSVISPPAAILGAKPNFDELEKYLGISATTPLSDHRRLAAEGLAQASAEAAFNAAVAAKGAGHASFDAPRKILQPVQGEMVDPRKNPLSGEIFPSMATPSEKLALVLQSSHSPSEKLYDCDQYWWCLLCNARTILRVCSKYGLFSLDDLREGRFRLTDEIKKEIVSLEPGTFRCNKHPLSGKKYRGMANPPTGVKFLCVSKSCKKFIHTSTDQITPCCSECGLDYSGCDTNEAIDVELSKARGITAELKEIDELSYAYLTSVGGIKVIEGNKQRIVSSLSQARLAINYLRGAPTSITGPYARLRSPLSGRKLCWGPIGRFRRTGDVGLWLWDFLPKVITAETPFPHDQLNNILKLAEKGGGEFTKPVSPMKLPKTSDAEQCSEFVALCLTCFEIALEQISLLTCTGYAMDIAVSVELARNEFQSQFKQYPPAVVFAILNAFLEDTSLRIERAASAPQVDHLTYYKRNNGGSIRWIFNLSCAGVLQHVLVQREKQLDSMGWTKSDTMFDIGEPSGKGE